jgi:CheY-like chemotaxis protein
MLEKQGAVVEEAASAASALLALTRFDADVVISDIGMPVEDGYMLARQMRSHAMLKLREMPALALSAYVRPEDEARSLEAGFDKHLGKPAEVDVLTRSVLEVLQQRRAQVRA